MAIFSSETSVIAENVGEVIKNTDESIKELTHHSGHFDLRQGHSNLGAFQLKSGLSGFGESPFAVIIKKPFIGN